MNESNVRALAVSYHALLESIDKQDSGGANTWAYILDKAQKATGVYLMQEQTLAFWASWEKVA